MNKLESLEKLLETIETKDKLVTGNYCRGENNCVIGHLLKIGNVSQEQLIKIDKGVYGHSYAIGTILRDGKLDFVNDSLVSLGFAIESDIDILEGLQLVNDYQGTKEVKKHLKVIIQRLKEE